VPKPVDSNRPREDAQDVPTRETNPHDPQHQGGIASMSRCPMHSILEEVLDDWLDEKSEF
jgi:hypothetical protein